MFIQEVIGIIPKKRGICPHIGRRISQSQYGVSSLIMDIHENIIRIMLLIICLVITWRDVSLAQDLPEDFSAFHMAIVRADVGWCIIFSDEGFQVISSLDFFHRAIDIPKEVLIATEKFLTPVLPYLLGAVNRYISVILLSEFCLVQMGKYNFRCLLNSRQIKFD